MTNPHSNQTRMVSGQPKGETKLADGEQKPQAMKRLKALRPFRMDIVEEGGRPGVRHVEVGEIIEVDEKTAQNLIRERPGQYAYMGEMYSDIRNKVKLAEPAL